LPIPPQVVATPTICGLYQRYAWRVLEQKWDELFSTVLKNEDKIFQETFRTYVVATQMKRGIHVGFDYLKVNITAPRNSFWKDAEEFDEAMKEAHRGYWNLATIEEYWKPGRYRQPEGWLDHKSALDVWRARDAMLISDWKADWDTWRSDN
jgi:hypothetical protein